MSGFYNRFLNGLGGGINWSSDTIKALLLRDTSTYAFDPDDDFVSDVTGGGGIEISVGSYARVAVSGRSNTLSDANNNSSLSFTSADFGSLESGQTVEAVIFYKEVTNDSDSPLIYYNNGIVKLVLAADASSGATSIWTERLPADIPSGTSLDFGGGATATTSSAASKGDRSLAISSLGANATAGDKSDAATNVQLPAPLGGGSWVVNPPTGGFIIRQPHL